MLSGISFRHNRRACAVRDREAGSAGAEAQAGARTGRRNMHSGECRVGRPSAPAKLGYIVGMAIAFARARYIGRSSGGSATRSAAYNARTLIPDQRTGESFTFAHRGAPEHHAVLLPAGAD